MVTRGQGGREKTKKVKWIGYVLKEGDWALGGDHTVEYTDVLQNCTSDIYMMDKPMLP